jgi:hypothetical protein
MQDCSQLVDILAKLRLPPMPQTSISAHFAKAGLKRLKATLGLLHTTPQMLIQ